MVELPVVQTRAHGFMKMAEYHGLLRDGVGKNIVYAKLVRLAESKGFNLTVQERDQALRVIHNITSLGLPDVFDALDLGRHVVIEILFEWGEKAPQLEGAGPGWEHFLSSYLRGASHYTTLEEVSLAARAYNAGYRDGSYAKK